MKIYLTLLLVIFYSLAFAQDGYEVSMDTKHPNEKVLRGVINKYLLQNDTAFSKWYSLSQKEYMPDTSVLAVFRKDQVQFVLFGGTWCDDSQYILPRFFLLQEKSGVPDSAITFFGVNRKKEALGNIAKAFAISNVPTIIVMKNGKEIGRVVEYGKTGKWEKELADIITSN